MPTPTITLRWPSSAKPIAAPRCVTGNPTSGSIAAVPGPIMRAARFAASRPRNALHRLARPRLHPPSQKPGCSLTRFCQLLVRQLRRLNSPWYQHVPPRVDRPEIAALSSPGTKATTLLSIPRLYTTNLRSACSWNAAKTRYGRMSPYNLFTFTSFLSGERGVILS